MEIDPVEAEVVRLIFRLYLEGDRATNTPPLGVKETVKWLNKNGYTTKRGGLFGAGALHHILTNTAYVGRWPYNVRDSQTGEVRPASEWVDIPTPRIIDDATFEAVKAKLVANNPKVSPVRAVSGPILLTGLATCAHCGAGMTQRTGTSRSGRVYAYYTCAGRAQKGPEACRGNTIPMAKLDSLVLSALEERLLQPERLTEVLLALLQRRAARAQSIETRLVNLQSEVARAEEVVAFGTLMRDVLQNAATPARKLYLRALLSAVEVDDNTIRLRGNRDVLAAAVAGTNSGDVVQFTGPKWRARRDSNSRPPDS